MSPEVKATSPRNIYNTYNPYNSDNKNTITNRMNCSSSSYGHQYKQSMSGNGIKDTEATVYSANYSKKGYESQEKAKGISRCLIRPKDLPGYRNY